MIKLKFDPKYMMCPLASTSLVTISSVMMAGSHPVADKKDVPPPPSPLPPLLATFFLYTVPVLPENRPCWFGCLKPSPANEYRFDWAYSTCGRTLRHGQTGLRYMYRCLLDQYGEHGWPWTKPVDCSLNSSVLVFLFSLGLLKEFRSHWFLF